MKKIPMLSLLLFGLLISVEWASARPRPMRADTTMPIENRRRPRPAIMPGAGLDTAVTKLPAQDPAVHQVVPGWLRAQSSNKPTYIIDGKVATVNQMKALRADDVVSVNNMDGNRAADTYGSTARNGLVIITTKKGM